jgi:arylsulfatase A-like enzyme
VRRGIVIILVLAVVVLGGSMGWDYLKRHGGLGMLGRIIDPIGPTQEVVWEPGPSTASTPVDERPPNIVVILADDLGYNDLTWRGGGVADGAVPTPNIDSIAREGVEFTAGYAGNATCAPSRAAIMTGRYPTRFGFEFTPAPAFFMRMVADMAQQRGNSLRGAIYYEEREEEVPWFSAEGVPPEEITIAELLQANGYHTVMLGKWHLGGTEPYRPEVQGFDEFLGFRPGGQMYADPDDPDVVHLIQDFDPIDPFLWANLPFAVRKNSEGRFTPPKYMTDYLSDEAVRAIEANRNRPFFLYLAYNAPHTPLQATKSDYDALSQIEHHPTRVYGGMIRSLDRGVGQVLDALKKSGLEDNTLVIFTTDNGGAHYIGLPDINRPYRGWKMTFFEGGLHAPFFAKWPAGLPQGTTYDKPVAHLDLFATAAGAAGAPLPTDRPIDGVNLIPFVRGEAQGNPHEALFWRSGHYRMVMADGWKLQVAERPKKNWLFNLKEDPTEQVNLAETNPAKVRELMSRLTAHDAQMVEPAWPALIEGAITIDHPLGVPNREDDEYVYWPN